MAGGSHRPAPTAWLAGGGACSLANGPRSGVGAMGPPMARAGRCARAVGACAPCWARPSRARGHRRLRARTSGRSNAWALGPDAARSSTGDTPSKGNNLVWACEKGLSCISSEVIKDFGPPRAPLA